MNHHQIIQPQEPLYNRPATTYGENEKFNFISTEQLYNAVFKNAFHAMYIGTGKGKIIKFNRKFTQLFQYPENEMAHMDSRDLLETHDKPFKDFLNERKEKGIAKAEITGIKKSGERFPCRISSVLYESDHGEQRSMNTLVNISDNLSARWNIAG